MAVQYAGRIVKAGAAAEVGAAAPPPRPSELQSAERRASELLETAQQQATQLVADAEAEAVAIVERGKATGLAEGKVAATMKLIELSEDFQTGIATLEADIAGLVVRGVERILAQTPPQEKLDGVIRAAVRDLQDKRALILTVAPEDLGFVQTMVARYQRNLTRPIRTIVADDALPEGECRLSDGRSELRVDVESQLTALRAALSLTDGPLAQASEG